MGDHDHHHHDDHHHDDHHHGGHEHDHDPLERLTHVHGGPTVLDIGDGVGAMVVLVGDDLLGTELFVEAESGRRSVHTGVWRRQLGDRMVAAAVFCELEEGRYRIVGDHDANRPAIVSIVSGVVTELDLRAA